MTIATPATASAMPRTTTASGTSPRAASTRTATTGIRKSDAATAVALARLSAAKKVT
jgi:hypothetical protein